MAFIGMVDLRTDIIVRETKICTQCGDEKAIGLFANRPQSADGHESECKACTKRKVDAKKAQKKEDPFSKFCF
jgi:hypothetical protein